MTATVKVSKKEEDVTNSNLQSNIVEPSVTITIGEDVPSRENEFTTEIKLEKEENETNKRYFCFMKVQHEIFCHLSLLIVHGLFHFLCLLHWNKK